MLYPLKAEIKYSPNSPSDQKTKELAEHFHLYLRALLQDFGIDVALKESYYHPDEESEMQNVDYVVYYYSIDHSVKHASSLADITLILSSIVRLWIRIWGKHFEIDILS